MAKILWGFGGVVFTDGVTTATFSGGIGTIDYRPIQPMFQTVNDGMASRLRGFHAYLSLQELYNVDSDDYIQYQNLATIISGMVSSTEQKTITITPRNDSTIEGSLTYTCILLSSIKPADLHRVKTGQRMGLEFMDIRKLTSIPTTVSDTDVDTYVDDSGDTYVDDSGDSYVDQ